MNYRQTDGRTDRPTDKTTIQMEICHEQQSAQPVTMVSHNGVWKNGVNNSLLKFCSENCFSPFNLEKIH